MVCLEYLAADIGCLDIELHIVVVEALLCNFFQFIEGILPISCLMPAGLRHASHPLQLGTVEVIGAFHFYGFGFNTLFALLQIITVITLILVYLAVVYLYNFRANAVQKVTVVRHHQKAEIVATQIFFQPFRHIKVEVVGRFVQYQQIGFSDKGIGKRHTLQLAAGQVFHLLVEVTDLELRKDLFGFLFVLPGFLMVHTHQYFVQSGMAFRLHATLIFLNQLNGAVAMMETGFEHSQFFGILRILLQIANTQITPEGYSAGIVPFLTGKDIKQCSLTRTVLGYQADALPFGQTEGYILE